MLALPSRAEQPDTLQAGLSEQVRALALEASRRATPGIARVEVSVGQLNPRLRLAPCQRVEPYLPNGTVLWGKARIGLRCTQGPSAWNVYLPITVSAWGKAWVATVPLSAGTEINAADLAQAEVDLAESNAKVIGDAQSAIGRTLARSLNAGQAVRETDLKARQWFSAGDEVKVLARGSGFSVAGMGQALGHGLEGQSVRVRIESGRVVTGMPVGERQVELPL
ncbi:MAG: flagellar basal body P-ring formation chaperone FlgA [Rhizobacter sp.]|nr:flagellar basal body P-ring formation chaperone FlgA [Rhizobacter sp.]